MSERTKKVNGVSFVELNHDYTERVERFGSKSRKGCFFLFGGPNDVLYRGDEFK